MTSFSLLLFYLFIIIDFRKDRGYNSHKYIKYKAGWRVVFTAFFVIAIAWICRKWNASPFLLKMLIDHLAT